MIVAGVFLAVMIFLGYDISSRTTWPGSKPQSIERGINSEAKIDTTKVDSLIIVK